MSATGNKAKDAAWQSTADTMFSSSSLNLSRLLSNVIAQMECHAPILKTMKYSFTET